MHIRLRHDDSLEAKSGSVEAAAEQQQGGASEAALPLVRPQAFVTPATCTALVNTPGWTAVSCPSPLLTHHRRHNLSNITIRANSLRGDGRSDDWAGLGRISQSLELSRGLFPHLGSSGVSEVFM